MSSFSMIIILDIALLIRTFISREILAEFVNSKIQKYRESADKFLKLANGSKL